MKRLVLTTVAILATFNFAAFKKHSPEDNIRRTVKNISVCNPIHYKNLTIFPLAMSRGRDSKSIITLDRALDKNYIEIIEKESGDVNTVLLVNKSKYYVFILSGEVIKGCKQDRMVSEDCLIPPNSGKIHLSVYCTEHGRWTAQSKKFGAAKMAISPKMRGVAKESQSQSEVWAQVEEKRDEVGAASSPTSRYMDIVEDKEVAGKLKSYVDKFSNIPNVSGWNTIGVLAAVGDEIIVVDLFSNHKLFKSLWEKLVKSYALDAIHKSPEGKLSKNNVMDFIRELNDADLESRNTDGTGDAYTVDGDCSFGTTLIFDGKIVHLDLFPRQETQHPKRIPLLDIRREGGR